MPRPLCGLLAALSTIAVIVGAPTLAQTAPAASRPKLTLPAALARAAQTDPSVAGAAARVAAAEAGLRQAAVTPNASLNLELENLAGTGPYSLFDRTEATLSYEKPLERGGKREARLGRARAELEVTRLRAQVARLDVLRDVQLAYAEALAAEAELLVAEARLISAHRAQADVARRVRSARDPLFAGSRAEALTAQAEIARDRAREAARTARAALAAYWGGGEDIALDLETFFAVTAPVVPAQVDAPDLALLEAERDVAAAAVRVEQSRNVADPTVYGGVRYFREGSDLALVVGASLPLGVANTNRANVERAQAERSAAEQDVALARLNRQRELARLGAGMQALAMESERIRAEVIPHAIRTVEQVTAGFNRGGFEHSDVNEAERALAEARARRVEVLREFHAAQASFDRLTGKHRALAATTLEERR